MVHKVARFAGKTAIVTGASRGIGLAIAQRLVDEGARVVVTARHQEALEDAVGRLGGPEKALAVAGKADDRAHQAEAVAAAIEAFGSADLLVNNTGINPYYGPLVDLDLDLARKVIDVNVVAALAWTQQAYRQWMRRHGGAVLNVASVGGIRPSPMLALYGSTKAMLIHLTANLAVELAPGVRVNALAPGVVKTKFAAALYEGHEQETAAGYPLQRLGLPTDVSGAAAFLLSDEASWITGEVLVVDGGLTQVGGA